MSTLLTFSAFFFFFNDTATTEIYTLSLHDALPICRRSRPAAAAAGGSAKPRISHSRGPGDRKSTRLNSSHSQISYAVFCLKKKNKHSATLPVARLICCDEVAYSRHVRHTPSSCSSC